LVGVTLLPTTTARALLQGFEYLGLNGAALRAAAKLDEAALAVVDGVLPQSVFAALWGEAFRQAPREELPTELGFAVPFGAFGPVDYLASSSATVKAAFHSLRTHFRRVGSMQLELLEESDWATVQLVNAEHFEGEQVSDEMTLALFVARFRLKAREATFLPRSIRLTRKAPEKTSRHATLFGAPVQFGCRLAALELPMKTWEAPLPDADPALQLTLRQLAERLELGTGGSDLELALRARLREALPEGDAEASGAAEALGLSERTLHRRLQALGTTWREVLDGFREAEAERLLSAGAVPMAEVALRLGFSDQTAWNRAFKRWKGRSPTEWLKHR
jgi:AraC-like DNA-binding protein